MGGRSSHLDQAGRGTAGKRSLFLAPHFVIKWPSGSEDIDKCAQVRFMVAMELPRNLHRSPKRLVAVYFKD
jgi:hypothetical protein